MADLFCRELRLVGRSETAPLKKDSELCVGSLCSAWGMACQVLLLQEKLGYTHAIVTCRTRRGEYGDIFVK